MGTNNANTRVQRRRAALRQAGLRPVQIWAPDTRRPDFAEECRRQCRLAQNLTGPTRACKHSWMKLLQMRTAGRNDARRLRQALVHPDYSSRQIGMTKKAALRPT